MFGTVALLYFARDVLIPLAFALTLAFLLSPIVSLLERTRLPRVPSVIVTVFVAVVAIGVLAWVLTTQLVDVANQLPQYRQNIHNKIMALRLPTNGAFGRAAKSLREVAQELSVDGAQLASSTPSKEQPRRALPVQIAQPEANQLTYLRDLAQPFLKPLGMAGIVLIFTIFILMEKEDLRNRLLRLAGIAHLNLMTQAIDDGAQRVSRYLLMQFLVNTVFGTSIGIGLYLIGLPNAGLWGAVAGMLRIVPYAGTLISGLLPILLSLAVFDGWVQPLAVFLLFGTLELITGNFIEPLLYGAHTGISSLALLVTTVFWTALWGPPGLILATPLTVCLVVVGRYAPQLEFLHILLGDDQVLGSDAQFYQRLLAMDQHEARGVVDIFLKTRPVSELYDEVIVPALTMAEHDRHRGAIDAEREEFLFLNINELVAELSEFRQMGESDENHRRPSKGGPRVLCVPARDQADEITAAMLSQLLEQNGCIALSFPAGPAAGEVLSVLDPKPEDVICVSALPPFAFTPARAMCHHIRKQFPGVRLLVGVWGFNGDTTKAIARFDRTPPDRLFTSMTQLVSWICEPEPAAQAEVSEDLARVGG